MPSIFLTNAPYFLKERYGKLASVGATLPTLGLLMLGAVLRVAGNRVRVMDASAQGLGYREIIEGINKFRPDVIGLTALTPTIARTAKLASMIKDIYPSTPIIIGGPHVTALPEPTLLNYPSFDYGVIGEGEETAMGLVEALSAGRIPSNVPGIAFRENGKVNFTSCRQPIENLDALPFPAWDLLDGFPFGYHPAIFKYKKLPSTHIVSARGCPNKCIFCDTSVFGHRSRFHSPEYVLEMVNYLVKDFKIKEIIFEDDQFLIKSERVEKICRGFMEYGWGISWCCSGRADYVNDPALLRLMKLSGCWQINYGIESGNQRILNFAKKAVTINQIEKAVRLTHEAGILSKGYFIFGLPYETEETMTNSIRFAKRIPLQDIGVFMLTPFPGSEMYNMAGKFGTIEKGFEKMNILNVLYVPNGLLKETLLYYQKRFMKEFYLRPAIWASYLGRVMENPRNLPNVLKAGWGFLRYVVTT